MVINWRKILGQSAIWIVLLLLYLPVFYLIAFSFNDSTILGAWVSGGGFANTGLTGALYDKLFHNAEIGEALGNTVIIALISASVSTLLGTLGAIGAYYCKKRTVTVIEGINNIPIVNAEVVIAMSLTVTFVFAGNFIFHANLFSFWTLLVGHVILGLPFVYLNVKPKLLQMNPELYEAALDLNATPSIALRKVVLPQVLPGVFSGFILSISLSLDDLIVTNFLTGPGLLSGDSQITTLSTFIQARIVKGTVPPELRALATFIFLAVLSVVIGNTVFQNLKARRSGSVHARRRAAFAKR